MQYIEVFYLDKMKNTSRRFKEYEKDEVEIAFKRTIGKLTMEKQNALIVIRDENHQLIKSELLK